MTTGDGIFAVDALCEKVNRQNMLIADLESARRKLIDECAERSKEIEWLKAKLSGQDARTGDDYGDNPFEVIRRLKQDLARQTDLAREAETEENRLRSLIRDSSLLGDCLLLAWGKEKIIRFASHMLNEALK